MEKKKRGRKPKKKDENEEKKIPKKRGRKPKNNIENINSKEHLIFKSENELISDVLDNNLILHLKINSKNIKNNIIPYNNDNNNFSLVINNKILSNDTNKEFKLNDKKDVKTQKFLEKYNYCFLKQSVYNTFSSFVYDNKTDWPISTNISCLWCAHQFKTVPCGIPIKYIDNKFHLKGCFCSFNCSASYIFEKNEYNKWEQYSLLNLLCSKINNKIIKIKLAPDRELLKIFGGILSIDEFRQNFTEINTYYKINLPPLVAIVPKIEETKINNKLDNNFIPINENLLSNAEQLNTNTFDSFMDIKIVNKN